MNVIIKAQMPPLILGGKEGRRREKKSLFRNIILATESEPRIRSFVYPTTKKWKSTEKLRY